MLFDPGFCLQPNKAKIRLSTSKKANIRKCTELLNLGLAGGLMCVVIYTGEIKIMSGTDPVGT